MEARTASFLNPEEFHAFCGKGRLAGTDGNKKAAETLKKYIEQAGFTPSEIVLKPTRRFFAVVFLYTGLLAALSFLWKNQSFFIVLILAMGLQLRLWLGIRRGTPLAIWGAPCGVEPDPGSSDRHRPTLILCAHFDSAYVPFPFSGSPLRGLMSAVALLVVTGFLSKALHPTAGPITPGLAFGFLYSAYLFGNASPGADDNASGVFAVLECLRRFGHQSGVNIIPVFFNYEEQGLIGSRAWLRRHFGRNGKGIPGVAVDPKQAYVINFDCVGRGRRVFVSGNRYLREQLLATPTARAIKAARTWFYPSDHWVFRSPWKAVSFARANRFWALDLGWVHSKKDTPTKINLEYVAEIATIVEEFVQDWIAQQAALRGKGNTTGDAQST